MRQGCRSWSICPGGLHDFLTDSTLLRFVHIQMADAALTGQQLPCSSGGLELVFGPLELTPYLYTRVLRRR